MANKKRIWSAKELYENSFGKAWLEQQFNRSEDNLSDQDYIVLDNYGNYHIYNVKTSGNVSSDTFEGEDYDSEGETQDQEQEHNLYNQNHNQQVPNVFIKKVIEFVKRRPVEGRRKKEKKE